MAEDYDIKLFAMGGTIDKTVYSYDHFNYVVGAPQAEQIFGHANLNIKISIESITRKDSLELGEADFKILHERIQTERCPRIIITHGTDTVSTTAKKLIEMPNISDKTIVFTGAMLPAKFIDSDAAFNLGGAVIAVQTLPPPESI